MLNCHTSEKSSSEIDREIVGEKNGFPLDNAQLFNDPIKAESLHLDIDDLSFSQLSEEEDLDGQYVEKKNEIKTDTLSYTTEKNDNLISDFFFNKEVSSSTLKLDYEDDAEKLEEENTKCSPHIIQAIQTMETLCFQLRKYMKLVKSQNSLVKEKDEIIFAYGEEISNLRTRTEQLEKENSIYKKKLISMRKVKSATKHPENQLLQKDSENMTPDHQPSSVDVLVRKYFRENEAVTRNKICVEKISSKDEENEHDVFKIGNYNVPISISEGKLVVITRTNRYVDMDDFIGFVKQQK